MSSRVPTNQHPNLPNDRCPGPDCGRERATQDGKVRRHCPDHEMQIHPSAMSA